MDILLIENLLISHEYDQCFDLIEELEFTNKYLSGIKDFLSYKLFKDEIFIDKSNPFCCFHIDKKKYFQNIIDSLDDCNELDLLYKGITYYDNQDYDKSMLYLNKIKDNTIAKSFLGQIALDNEQYEEGLLLLSESIEYCLSAYFLANCFNSGYGVVPDKKIALKYYEKAREFNMPEANYILGLNYLNQDFQDYSEDYCISLINQAAQKGHIYANIFMINHYYKTNENMYFDYLIKMSVLNNPELNYLIGIDFLNGYNLNKDYDKAIYFLELSANCNYQKAINKLNEIKKTSNFIY